MFAKGSVTDYPLTIRHRDGELTDVLYNASVYKDVGAATCSASSPPPATSPPRSGPRPRSPKQRAKELERLAELERFQRLTVGRELKMIELKKEIEDLRAAARGE